MKEKILILCCTLFTTVFTTQAQVTIGTNQAPQKYSILEVVSSANNTGGLRLPHLSDADKATINSDILGDPEKSQGLLIYSTANNRVEFWDGTKWVAAQGSSSGPIPTEPWLVSGGTTEATSNTENIYQMGQVTIGSGANAIASAALNVEGTNKGALLPRVELTGVTDQTTIPAPAIGLLVYNKGTNVAFPTAGYMYWSGTQWELAKAVEPWMISGTINTAMSNTDNIYQMGNIGIGTMNPLAVFHVDAAKDNAETPTAEQLANDFIITPSGSVGIGTTTPDPSAILDISATNKGLLGPRIALNSITDITTIPDPANGLLAYNTGAGALDFVGYVFWNGTEWRALNNGSLAPGTIGAITCNGVTLTPSIYKAGEYFEGTMIVPYTGGNGGVYAAQTLGPVNGLTATLPAGNFNVGSGDLAYTITGIPEVTTPDVTVFNVNIGGQTCSASIGAGDGIAPGDLVYYSTTLNASLSGVWLSAYAKDLPVLGGKLRLDAYFNATSNAGNGHVSMYPRLVNISDSPVKFWFAAITTVDRFNASNYVIAPNGYVELDNGIYYNTGYNDILGSSTPRATGSGEGGHQEVVTVDVSLDNKWYRIYYFPIVDNMNTPSTADNLRQIYLSIQRLY